MCLEGILELLGGFKELTAANKTWKLGTEEGDQREHSWRLNGEWEVFGVAFFQKGKVLEKMSTKKDTPIRWLACPAKKRGSNDGKAIISWILHFGIRVDIIKVRNEIRSKSQ